MSKPGRIILSYPPIRGGEADQLVMGHVIGAEVSKTLPVPQSQPPAHPRVAAPRTMLSGHFPLESLHLRVVPAQTAEGVTAGEDEFGGCEDGRVIIGGVVGHDHHAIRSADSRHQVRYAVHFQAVVGVEVGNVWGEPGLGEGGRHRSPALAQVQACREHGGISKATA